MAKRPSEETGTFAVYPGTFSPPHFGHLRLLEEASRICGRVTLACSVNPDKDGALFAPAECKALWHCYDLPAGGIVRARSRAA